MFCNATGETQMHRQSKKNLRLGSRPFTFIGHFNETSSPDLVRGQHKKSSQTGGQYEEDSLISFESII